MTEMRQFETHEHVLRLAIANYIDSLEKDTRPFVMPLSVAQELRTILHLEEDSPWHEHIKIDPAQLERERRELLTTFKGGQP